MVNGDFFGFCTTLKPLQLKAMGELSEVVHLEQGETVYSPGDVGDSLYIINRGVVELGQENGAEGPAETYLSRGEIFGDVNTERLCTAPNWSIGLPATPQRTFRALYTFSLPK